MTGFDISKDFFADGECCVEAQIESEIGYALRTVCPYINVRKSKLGKGITDGVIRLYDYKHDYKGFIINESKRDKHFEEIGNEAFVQGMLYAGSFLYDVSLDKEINASKFIGFFLTTAYDFCFVPIKENWDIVEKFYPIYKKYHYIAPHKALTETVLKDFASSITLKCKLYTLDKNFILDDLINTIYSKYGINS